MLECTLTDFPLRSCLQYNVIITARILLSWFPQAQGIGLLQPVYSITGKWKGRMTNDDGIFLLFVVADLLLFAKFLISQTLI